MCVLFQLALKAFEISLANCSGFQHLILENNVCWGESSFARDKLFVLYLTY
jgi:hypothetical protein